MTRDPFPKEPRRLIEGADDSDSEWLRAASRGYESGLDERKAWNRLQQRQQHARRQRAGLLGATVLASCALLLIAHQRGGPRAVLATAEPARAEPIAQPLAQVDQQRIEPAPSAQLSSSARLSGPPPPANLRPPSPTAARVVRPAASERENSAPLSEELCRQLENQGALQRAAECFRKLASGEAVAAEVALYQLYRLQAAPLREPSAALSTLDEYTRRFPQGVLRGEVELGRVRLLVELGKNQAALDASEALLGRQFGRALSSELHLLRGKLYEDKLLDCSRAVTEYVALLGESTAAGDDAEFRRAGCLDRLGRVEAARAAYARYLERGRTAHGPEARARLAVLAAASPTP